MPKYMIVSNMKMYAWIAPMNEVERLPDDLAEGHDVDRQQRRHDHDHESAGEEVAEETEGQRDGLGDLLDRR